MFKGIFKVLETQTEYICEETEELLIYSWAASMALSLGLVAEEYELTVVDFSPVISFLDNTDEIINRLNNHNQNKASIIKLVENTFINAEDQFTVLNSDFIHNVCNAMSWTRSDKAIEYIDAEPIDGLITADFLNKLKLIIKYRENIYG